MFNLITPYSDYTTERTTDESSVDCHRNKKCFSSPKLPDRLWCPPSLVFNWYRGLFLLAYSSQAVNLSIQCVWCRDQEHCCSLLYHHCLMAFLRRDALVQLAEALRYKPEVRGFDSRCCLILTHPGIFSEEQRRPGRRADTLTTFTCRLSRKLGTLNSWNPMGCNRHVQGLLYPFTFNSISKKYDSRKNCLIAGFIWCYPTNLTSAKSAPFTNVKAVLIVSVGIQEVLQGQ
jgi:hypothetical protein